MRILMLFSLGFLIAALLIVLEVSWWLCLPVFIFSVAACVFYIRKKPSRRFWKGMVTVSAGVLVGILYCFVWKQFFINRAETLNGQQLPCAVELTDYPTELEYGWSGSGIVHVNGITHCVTIQFTSDTDDFCPGDIISGLGVFQSTKNGDSPYYYRSIGIPLKISMRAAKLSGYTNRGSLRYLPQRIAKEIRTTVNNAFPDDVSGFIGALLTGEKAGLTYLEKSELKTAGIYHALAVSGMHVAILMSGIFAVSLHNRKLYLLLGLPVLFLYCLVTGMAASVLRASVMQLFLMVSMQLKREPDSITSLSAAGLALTIQNPWCLLNTGFQLSFLATAGIILFSSTIQRTILGNAKPHTFRFILRRILSGTVSQTLSALILTLPLLVFEFGMVSVLGMLTNLLTIQVITFCFTAGFVICGLWFLWPGGAMLLAVPVSWLIRYVKFVVAGIAKIPFAAVYTADAASVIAVLSVYLGLFIILYFGKAFSRKGVLICIGCICLVLFGVVAWSVYYRYSAEFFFHALDVGQGECILLESKGRTLAYDCGGSDPNSAGEKLVAALRSRHYTQLDYLVLSHYDLDHTGGCSQLFARLRVGILILPDISDDSGRKIEIETMAQEHGTAVYYISEDKSMTFGNGSITLYAPAKGAQGNEASMTMCATFGDFDIIIMGDLPSYMEEEWLNSHEIPDTEILVAAHHGSRNATGERLLRATKPEAVVISVGSNSYGHPSDITIQRIADIGAVLYRTDLLGDISYRR